MNEIDTKPIAEKTTALVRDAENLTITNAEQYCAGIDQLKALKLLGESIDATFDPHIEAHNSAKKALLATKSKFRQPVNMADQIIRQKILEYQWTEEAKRREAERIAQEEAQKHEEDRRIAEAASLEKQGMKREAEELMRAPISVPQVEIQSQTPEVAGVSTRTQWSAEIVDLMCLVRYVAEHPEFIGLLLPNQTALNQQARSLKSALSIPGVRAVQREILNVNAKEE